MNKKQKIIITAKKLFTSRGFLRVGIEQILQESGVAKMTLYKHFASKDDLAAAVVREKSACVLKWLNDTSDVRSAFQKLENWLVSPNFCGCLFTRATQDFPNPSHPARKAVATHTRKVLYIFEKLKDSRGAGQELFLLFEGATAAAVKTGARADVARKAIIAAETLLKN